MRKTLLEIVKDILSDVDGQDVNTISDTVEALQAAKVVEAVFNDLVATRQIPEHETLIKLTPLSDNQFPTHFVLEDSQTKIKDIWYDVSGDASFDYRLVRYLSPVRFLRIVDKRQGDFVYVEDRVAGTKLRIGTKDQPTYYTSFDDKHIVMDSYDSAVDSTLQNSKVRAIGTTYPVFQVTDTYVPQVDNNVFPYIIQESKSRFMSLFKGSVDQKTEQSARRVKVHMQNDMHRLGHNSKRRNYGRR
jgi:hypothetical protein